MAVCDNYQCYGNIPNMADMAPIAPFDTVYMRVETNPFETPGEGVVRFRIYENGYQIMVYISTNIETIVEVIFQSNKTHMCASRSI